MIDNEHIEPRTKLGSQLYHNSLFKIGEILILLMIGVAFIVWISPLIGDNPLYLQLAVGVVNIILLMYIWGGLKLRGESWKDLGLALPHFSARNVFKWFLLSLVVAVLGAGAFILGSVVMVNITGFPETTDMSGYNYLKDNFGMLLLALGSVYIFSSFGEEVIYRAFLINRISELGNDTKKATVIAVILSSAIFGLIHYEWGPMGIVQTGFFGLVMGICYIWLKKRLWILIVAHVYMDTALLVQLYLGGS